MARLRLFLGVGLDQPLQRIVQDWRQQQRASLRWVADSNLHMTMVFLGMTEVSRIPAIDEAVRPCVQQQAAFTLSWQTVDWFPSAARARVLAWLPEAHAGLMAWQGRLQSALVVAGFDVEGKPYRPHISLARVRRAEPVVTAPQSLWANQWLHTLTLFQSDSTPKGVRYTPWQQWALKKPV